MEEYVAATAVRTLRETQLFTLPEVMDIVEFFRVKADIQPIFTEGDADRFITKVHRFIDGVRHASYPIYATQMAGDERAAERAANRLYAEGVSSGPPPTTPGGRLAEVLHETKLPIKPKVFNRGFRGAGNIYLRAFIAKPGGTAAVPSCVGGGGGEGQPDPESDDRCRLAIDLGGGAVVYPAYRHKTTGAFMPIPTSSSVDAFLLKVDQHGDKGKVGHVSFSLDLPERSVNESNRENNMSGFFYYLLDPTAASAPTVPSVVPKPISDPKLLVPDPFCLPPAQLQITQSILLDGEEYLSPVAAYIGAKAKLKLSVTNVGTATVADAQACTSLDGSCHGMGAIAAGQTVEKTIEYTPKAPEVRESVAVAKAADVGVSPSSLLRISAACEPLLLELDPNPNPERSSVMVGGRAVRHYMAVHPFTGAPARGVKVTFFGTLSSATGIWSLETMAASTRS